MAKTSKQVHKDKAKKARRQKITPENKCSFCTESTCCTYVTQQIDTPRSKADFELLLWQISHAGVEIYKDEDGWFLLFQARCNHLQPNGDCGIYEARPTICREHSNEYCEFDSPAEDGFDLYFDSYDGLLAYCRKRFKRWDKSS
jgi:Fe-S-cluster containining protein